MRNEYVTLNNVQTHLITWGDPFDCNGQDVIICITGNPGITDFYIDFGSELHRNTGLPLCVIGQAGHEEVPDEKSNVLRGQHDLFNLKGQLQHKLELINNYIDKQSKLHLIGHSIGAWLILELLRDNENLIARLSSVNLLFPTLQKMAETRNGKLLNNVIRNVHVLVLFLFYLAYALPALILTFLVEVYLKVQSLPLHYSKCILKFLRPTVGEKVLFLAYNEMDTVKSLNTEVLEKSKHLINVIYSNRDNWAPVSYMEELQSYRPHIHLTEVDIDHAFVLKSSEKVAEMVSSYIKTKI
ncbi:lipid droplet associated hydrolase sturkopf [Anticarsia gemmatalis]|uniref:lipid droplet associated hydrolase sturkopf n=1 Tax=Anticarsia gemmatalis TaxID=129554 RepID=UPI003F76817D